MVFSKALGAKDLWKLEKNLRTRPGSWLIAKLEANSILRKPNFQAIKDSHDSCSFCLLEILEIPKETKTKS